ncbi:MAG TPA: hypothetical protein VNL18_07935 [Gemmatimonadales bacterium]|nr:hypothetical protein [Gemmatimonadales bacterium]
MAEHRFEIEINLHGITNQLQLSLQRSMNLVAVGLQHGLTLSSVPPALPDTTIGFRFASNQQWNADQTRNEWNRWILTNGFRDVSEAIHTTLEEVQTVLAHWELASIQTAGKQVKVSDWNDIVVARGRRFHKLGLPDKLEFLATKYGFAIDADLARRALSINAVRNCYVHRKGVVHPQDVTANDNLTLEWRALTIIGTSPKGEQELVPGTIVEAGTEVGVSNRARSKDFPLGAEIMLTADEFAQVCWTIMVLAETVTQQLEKHGRAMGVKFRQPEGAA